VSDIKKRMASVKAKRFPGLISLPGETQRAAKRFLDDGIDPQLVAEFVKGAEEVAGIKGFEEDADSWEALDRAKQYFGTSESRVLALLMAEVLFGKQERGRSKGTKTTWTYQKYLELAVAASALWEKNPKLSDARVATLLSKTEAYKKFPAEVLRQHMKGAKQAARDYLEDMAIEEAEARRKGEL
jgi:hypothetical protein